MTFLRLALLLTAAAFPFSVAAQTTNCELSEAPEVRGFRLGTSTAEVRDRLRKVGSLSVNPKADDSGYAEAHIYASALEGKEGELSGLRGLEFQFLDDVLTALVIRYDNKTDWNSPYEFAKRVAQALNMPTSWHDTPRLFVGGRSVELTGARRGKRAIICNGFGVQVDLEGPELRLFNTTVSDILAKRREARERERKEGFRPE